MDVVAIGELLIDWTVLKNNNGYPEMRANPGGAPANYLAPISKYGLKTAFVGKVGNDTFGKSLVKTLKELKINTKNTIISDDYFTTMAFVTLDEKGNREFSFSRKPGADTRLLKEEIDTSLIDKTKVLHFGTVSLTDETSRSATHYAVEYAKRKKKIISFDPNLRKPLWKDLNKAKKEMEYGLKNSDIVKISDDEVKFLFNKKPLESINYITRKYPNIKILLVTCGENGSYWKYQDIVGHVDALKKAKVLDTTGAGDIFNGATMYKLLSYKKDFNKLSIDDVEEAVIFGSVVSGLSVTKYGGISSVPEKSEVLKLYCK